MKRIAITGGKGGTGKSTIATSFAKRMAEDREVILVDADVDCPDDHLLLGVSSRQIGTVTQRVPCVDKGACLQCRVCSKTCRYKALAHIDGRPPLFFPEQCNGCGACAIACPVQAISWTEKTIGTIMEGSLGTLTLLTGDLRTGEPNAERMVDGLLKEVKKRSADLIIFDTAAGTHCDVITVLKEVDMVYAVTEPTPLGLHDLELILKLAQKLDKKVSVILNKAGLASSGSIESCAAGYGAPVCCEVPYSVDTAKGYARGTIPPLNLMSIMRDMR